MHECKKKEKKTFSEAYSNSVDKFFSTNELHRYFVYYFY